MNETIAALYKELDQKRDIVAHLHRQHADDLCWMDLKTDLNRLYEAFGFPPGDFRVGDKPAMLANCERFVTHVCIEGGPWKSYVELEAELAASKANSQGLLATISAMLTAVGIDMGDIDKAEAQMRAIGPRPSDVVKAKIATLTKQLAASEEQVETLKDELEHDRDYARRQEGNARFE